MSSSRRSSTRVEWVQLLPGIGRVAVELYCTRYSNGLEKELRSAWDRGVLASIIPARLAKSYCAWEIALTILAVYTTRIQGYGIARNPGIDVLLYLAGQRNIAKVLDEYAPRPGEHVVIALAYSIKASGAVPRPSERLEPVENCVNAECSHYRSKVTRLAVFPIEERIYRFSETL